MERQLLLWNYGKSMFSLPNWWYDFIQSLIIDNETDGEGLADCATKALKTYDAYVDPDFIVGFRSNNKTKQYIVFRTLEGYIEFVLRWHV